MARKGEITGVIFSNFKSKILDLLKEFKFIKDFEVVTVGKKKEIKIILNTVVDPVNDIPEIKFFSKPSRPWYVSYKDLRAVAGGKGIGILSTNQWLMAAHIAKTKKLWGELIAEIY